MKAIQGFSRYSISKDGVVVSHIKYGTKERILKQYTDRDGYKRLHLSDDNKKLKVVGVHRLLLQTYQPINNENEMVVNHINGDKSDNRLENLEWCTAVENTRHAIENGHAKNIREVAPKPKLDQKKADEIRSLYTPYLKSRLKLAKEYGVNKSTIDRILAGTSWSSNTRSFEDA